MEKLNYDFCHNGIFSLPTLEHIQYKEIYKKYYQLNIQSYHIVKHACNDRIYHHLPIPKLSSNIDRNSKSYKCIRKEQQEYFYEIDNKDYDGIENIKLILITEHLLEDPVINLIRTIQIRIDRLNIAWDNVGLKIMHKLKRINLSETCYPKDKLQYYEIKINFNTKENWLPT